VSEPVETIVLIDLSSLVYPLWHMSAKEPDPNWTHVQALARIRVLAQGHRHVAVCADSRRSLRKELDPTYKANRPPADEPVKHQLLLTEEQCAADGFPVWKCDGFEADDVIASATFAALETTQHRVMIASSDKDLLQLVSERVEVMSLTNGVVYDETGVALKFGVTPTQMRDYLALVGDASDNIKGVMGIGAKKATDLLVRFGSLDILLGKMMDGQKAKDLDVQPMVYAALENAAANGTIAGARELIRLRTDAPIPFKDIFNHHVPQTAPEDTMNESLLDVADNTPVSGTPVTSPVTPAPVAESESTALATIDGAPVSGTWERQLEPRSADGAKTIAKWLYESRLFSQYGTPQAVFSIILAGRELGLGTMASLRGFHVVEGRPSMAADLIRSLVLSSGKAEYFMCKERTADRSTWATKRKGDPSEVTLTFTIDEAKQAKLVRPNSGWEKHPADMVSKTASSKLSRLVYPDVTFGLYSPEEEMGGDI
jgi:5'-3' exonuclease